MANSMHNYNDISCDSGQGKTDWHYVWWSTISVLTLDKMRMVLLLIHVFISTGVSQGSILGPLLFTIFINDFPKSSTFFSTRLYADDTSLTASGSDLDSLLREINSHLPTVYKWLCSNKLTLNLTKNKFLIFMPRQKESHNLYPPLTKANVHLEKSFSVKYLGVYIDCHLTWHDHIDYICGKISKNINIMVKLKRYVSKATLISVYYSLIYPYLTYACTLWGNNYNAPVKKVSK